MASTEIATMHSPGSRDDAGPLHVPVLVDEVVEIFRARSAGGGWIVDATLGLGGHSQLLLSSFETVRILGIDQDPAAIEMASERLSPFSSRLRLRQGRFSQLSAILRAEGIESPIGMLFDVGVSSLQLAEPGRGFSFQIDGPLDMRMDPTRDRTAADIINHWDESDLADLFYYEGGETRARQIAAAIVEGRRRAPFLRTAALADVIAQALGHSAGRSGGSRIHPATKSFQALRRAVNEEGDELLEGLRSAEQWLADGGRLVVISFHSGEDGEVKRFLAEGARADRWTILTKKPIEASLIERRANPRSRSAKLRAATRRKLAPPRPRHADASASHAQHADASAPHAQRADRSMPRAPRADPAAPLFDRRGAP